MLKPYSLAVTQKGAVKEIISYPYVEGNDLNVKARDPGDPTTMASFKVADLRSVKAFCIRDNCEWDAHVTGEFRDCHVNCPKCGRGYYAVHADGLFVRFEADRVLTLR